MDDSLRDNEISISVYVSILFMFVINEHNPAINYEYDNIGSLPPTFFIRPTQKNIC